MGVVTRRGGREGLGVQANSWLIMGQYEQWSYFMLPQKCRLACRHRSGGWVGVGWESASEPLQTRSFEALTDGESEECQVPSTRTLETIWSDDAFPDLDNIPPFF
ncbi:hypothetical protein HAX54_011456 [Datura stramonium]|uniref:Uncharacterized protein n=1 Tax=Datura stramonium TaxID=4076 RepID=A0ABS8TI36_DATST|nr:hypothetical protein [Datura stramonium]